MGEPFVNCGVTFEQAKDAYEQHGSYLRAGEALGVSRATIKRRLQGLQGHEDEQGDPNEQIKTVHSENGMSLTVVSRSIRTKEDALKKAGLDEDEWEITKATANNWPVTIKDPRTGHPTKVNQWQFKLELRPLVVSSVQQAMQSLVERIEQQDIHHPAVVIPEYRDPHLLELALYDHHFGMLAWKRETGSDYDLRYAEYLYLEAVKGLLARARGYEIDEILLPVGQDFFHVNDQSERTPKNKNDLDVDGRLAKVFEAGYSAVVQAVQFARMVAPVTIKWVPGNHDPQTSYYLCQCLRAYYRNEDQVSVDVEPSPRKYHRYGVNLLGLTHADTEPEQELPNIMASECRDQWPYVLHCEWHTGHRHSRKEIRYLGAQTIGDMVVRRLPSLSARDYWHFSKGYQSERAAEGYLFNKQNGYAGHVAISAREILGQPD
jgi:hypothetical protein